MSDLTEFLLAEIIEDEADADQYHERGCSIEQGFGECDCGYPARVLAECEAKRRIVEWCTEREQVYIGTFADDPEAPRPDQFVPGAFVASPQDRFTLRLLASIYADHPDFDPEWRLP